ncbi:MAG: hypothetical protein WDM81_09600 [Rhizomicrobium sp.]
MKKRAVKPKQDFLPTAEDLAWEDNFIRANHAKIAAKLREAKASMDRGEFALMEPLPVLLRDARKHHRARRKKTS